MKTATIQHGLAERPAVRSGPSRFTPHVSLPLLRWFTWYSRRYTRRHFHSLRVLKSGQPPPSELPLVIYCNHASWWDALACLLLKDFFYPHYGGYAPIDAKALKQYRMFARLGFFGVEQGTPRGAAQFLRTAEAILQQPNRLLVITPQGRFADPRERPAQFQSGLGHLASRLGQVTFVPLALEYVFWEERLPEILASFGEPVTVRSEHRTAFDAEYWTRLFQEKLAATQDELAAAAQRRKPDEFLCLLRGSSGQGGIYDWWRGWRARLRGENFTKAHGDK